MWQFSKEYILSVSVPGFHDLNKWKLVFIDNNFGLFACVLIQVLMLRRIRKEDNQKKYTQNLPFPFSFTHLKTLKSLKSTPPTIVVLLLSLRYLIGSSKPSGVHYTYCSQLLVSGHQCLWKSFVINNWLSFDPFDPTICLLELLFSCK